MRRVQANDIDALERLYDRHVSRALRVAGSVCATRHASEDAVRAGFLSIWRNRASYRPEAGSFQGWSMRIIRNSAIDAERREAVRPQPRDGDRPVLESLPAPGTVEGELDARADAEALRRALGRLPDKQAEVIALAYYGGLTCTEIAKQLALPGGTVKGRMRLGLVKLRTVLGAAGIH